jgi:ferrochelatase
VDVVETYLRRFFSDGAILPVRQPLRAMIARGIARRRAPESAKNYAAIGGRSPLLDWTEKQRAALESRLNARRDGRNYRCATAMRYTRPGTADALTDLDDHGYRDVMVLPLYPQESCASTGSALSEVDRVLAEMNLDRGVNYLRKVGEVRSFEAHAAYIGALCSRITEGLTRARLPRTAHVLFSAHGLPQSYIDGGDPYQRHVEATVAAVVKRLTSEWGAPPRFSIAYQSRVGPQKWLEPDSAVEIQRLGREGVREMLVVPVAFVSDHVETLHEIGVLYASIAKKAGVDAFACTEGLNDSPAFIEALEEIVVGCVERATVRA